VLVHPLHLHPCSRLRARIIAFDGQTRWIIQTHNWEEYGEEASHQKPAECEKAAST
jgi:hypothetical protein